MAEQRTLGIFNVAGPEHGLTVGAMLEGIVQKATQRALRRCVASKKEKRIVLLADFEGAVEQTFEATQHKGVREAVDEVLATLPDGTKATWKPAGEKTSPIILKGR